MHKNDVTAQIMFCTEATIYMILKVFYFSIKCAERLNFLDGTKTLDIIICIMISTNHDVSVKLYKSLLDINYLTSKIIERLSTNF